MPSAATSTSMRRPVGCPPCATYCRMLASVQMLSKVYSSDFGRTLDPNSEIMVTQGANQGIAVALQAFVQKGDEVILIEPFFDIFKPSVEVYVRVRFFLTGREQEP